MARKSLELSKQAKVKQTAKKITLEKVQKKTDSTEKKTKPSSSKSKTSKSPQKAKTAASAKPTTMAELLAITGYELKAPKHGQVIEGVVTDISKKMVLLDIGGKTEGMVVDKEYEVAVDLIKGLSIGDTIKVFVVSPENDRGQILLSLRRASLDRKWEQLAEYLETGKVLEVEGAEVNRGGLVAQTEGIRGFVPSSQFSRQFLGKMDQLLGKKFKVKIIEVDKDKNRLIFSERHVSEADAMAQKASALKKVKAGDTYKGVVSGIMPFGVFVTVDVPLTKDKLGKVEGLVHISEISWEKVDDPNRHFRVGEALDVMVIGVNEDTGKLNLSVKRLKLDPWQEIDKKYVVGNKVTGKVTRVAPFGVFVTLEPGVDGLIHISKIPTGQEPKVGEDIDIFVESLDKEARRMSLGMVLKEVPVGYK